MRAPLFWKEKTFASAVLLPAAGVYGWVARKRKKAVHPYKVPVPVICIGNVVAGGAGKTPVALAIGAMLKARGTKACYLSRGYKGNADMPVQVDITTHTAHDVGDEPLLLARMLPTWVSKDRVAGAKAMVAAGAEIIIMDDGFQNPGLYKDVSLLVIDGGYGFGNGRIIPAGPLREPIASAMERASAIVLIGEDTHHALQAAPASIPVFKARLEPLPSAHTLQDRNVVAFAGIARPRKFYRTLQGLGCVIKKMIAYPDHHVYTARNIAALRSRAQEFDAQLVTTSKDYVRLSPPMREDVMTVEIEVIFDDPAALLKVMFN